MLHEVRLFWNAFLITAALLGLLFFESVSANENQVDYRYVINVIDSNRNEKINIENHSYKSIIYTVKVEIDGRKKYRARIGFFNSRKEALQVLSETKKKYPGAWLDTVKKYDQLYLGKWYSGRDMRSESASLKNTSLLMDKKETDKIMEMARKHIVDHEYEDAIKLYTRIISRGHEDFKQDAQEYLAVSREKNGQYAHAKAEYLEYLRLYPTGEGADRVKMRLDSMLLASAPPRRKLEQKKINDSVLWSNSGYVTEFYRYDKLRENTTTVEKSSSASSMGLFSRRRSDASDMKMQMTGDYLLDLNNPDGNRGRLTSLFVDYANRPKTASIRLGRQSQTRSGVLGRMDGIWADYQLHPQWKINLVAGHPVNYFESNQVQENSSFFGYSLDIGPFNQYWDFNLFKIEQQVDGVKDREATGGEIRYISPAGVFFTLVDYDTYYEELNKVYVVSTMRFGERGTLNLIYDRGKAPYMLTTNALQGQPYQSIDKMKTIYSENEIKQIARDRTSEITTSSISGSFPVSKDYMMNLDMTITDISGTPTSAGVIGTEPTGNEYYYGVQLIGNDVLFKRDTVLFGVRYTDGSTYQKVSYSASDSMMLNNKWRVNAGLYYELTNQTNGAKITAIKPSCGLVYQYSKALHLETDILYENSSVTGDTLPIERQGTSFNAGMTYDF